jgi:hypothetical protein
LSSTPTDWKPRRNATSEAPGIALRNACTPFKKSRWSYNKAAVSSDGAPSSNFNVPRRLSTWSGVEMDFRVSAETPPDELVVELIVFLLF